MAENNLFYDFEEGKIPYSVEAEQAVLGAMIVDPQSISEVVTLVKPEFFYIPQHKEIYTTIITMFEVNQVIDFVSLLEKLKTNKIYDEAGGKAYLTQLVQAVPSAANIKTYIDILRERYYARALIGAAKGILKDIEEKVADTDKLIDSAEQRIYDIRTGNDKSGLTPIKDIIEGETYERLTKISDPETHDDYVGIPCGIGELDKMITGLNKSDLIILGARPSMGKTSMALNIARNVAVDTGKTVCFFSLEMSRDQLAQRLLSSESGIDSSKLRTGELTADEWTMLTQAGAHLSETKLYFDQTSDITVPEMKAKLRRMKKVDLVIIDYLGLMHSARRIENRVQEISEITRNLKIMAKEFNIPVIVCSQLSRGTEGKGKSHKPGLADLRDSGSIEQDADIVLFLYREAYYNNEKTSEDDMVEDSKSECIVAKNRHGETGRIELHWDPKHTRFTSVDRIR
ncbi:MAG: replicative DNA helicase [Clostridia bacterium]|nr:replicative DNA helicase [Clostridia bacterium]